MSDQLKKCPVCTRKLPIEQFSPYRGRITTHCDHCKELARKRWFKDHENNKTKARTNYKNRDATQKFLQTRRNYEREWNLFPGQKELMVEQQDGLCAICQQPAEPLCIDHNHKTNKIRGLLCRPCNLGLGNFRDNSKALRAAADYLTYWDNWN